MQKKFYAIHLLLKNQRVSIFHIVKTAAYAEISRVDKSEASFQQVHFFFFFFNFMKFSQCCHKASIIKNEQRKLKIFSLIKFKKKKKTATKFTIEIL